MRRNIYLAYILTYLFRSWFWLGVWVLYYLRFTSYSGIGLLESIMIITLTLGEIPTGALADLLGKKKTLFISFLLFGLGHVIMGLTPGFAVLTGAVLTMTIGSALYSGTMEALVFDSLKQMKQEGQYLRIVSNLTSIKSIALAASSVVGGFLYAFNPRLPFLVVAAFGFAGMLTTLFLTEPTIDTEKFSLAKYWNQTRQGFRQLFKNHLIGGQTVRFLSLGVFVVIFYEVLNDVLAVEYGFRAEQLGIFFAFVFLVNAFASQLTQVVSKKITDTKAIYFMAIILAVTLVFSPQLGLILGGLTIVLRSAATPIFENLTSAMINQNTDSKYRATTISTFNMMAQTPYMLLAYPIGVLMDVFSAKNVAFFLGVAMLAVILAQQLVRTRPKGVKIS